MKYITSKLTQFLEYIAEGDEALKQELACKGPIRIIKTFFVWNLFLTVLFVTFVALEVL